MLTAILVVGSLATIFGLILGFASVRFHVEGDPLADKIDNLLPQTQCGQCTYTGCRPYAEAIANGEADINRCAPGGETTIKELSALLGVEPKPLDDQIEERPVRLQAVIDEQLCIGCTLCIQACPVDAILGASKQMHTVISEDCTGCELCLPPCPVECIDMLPVYEGIAGWKWPFPEDVEEQVG